MSVSLLAPRTTAAAVELSVVELATGMLRLLMLFMGVMPFCMSLLNMSASFH